MLVNKEANVFKLLFIARENDYFLWWICGRMVLIYQMVLWQPQKLLMNKPLEIITFLVFFR